jgi:hypothetical protein
MYKVDLYTDNHVRCGERVFPCKTPKIYSWIAGLSKTV